MFHRRRSSQRPGSELVSRFQESFGSILIRRNSDGPHPTQLYSQDDIHLHRRENNSSQFSSKLESGGIPGLGISSPSRYSGLLPLSLLANQHPDCYTPKSSGTGVILHNQAGNLHSPSLALTKTPVSRMPAANIHSGLDQFGTQYISPHNVQKIPDIQQPTHLPTEITFPDWGHGVMDKSGIDPTLDIMSFDSAAKPNPNLAVLTGVSPHAVTSNERPHYQCESFRYHVALRTPTAMVKFAEEIPISYLNKGQVYDLMIMDLNQPVITPEAFQYRTFIRISFDDEAQRSNPASNWRMWIEGRGTTESQQCGSDFFAIEFANKDKNYRHMQLEKVSIDGFCVTWNVESIEGTNSCTIPLIFNFLSTDFSHSKGVKGISVRLCAKTELLPLESAGNPSQSEVCYCKVKLFREHGAERKMTSDLQHVRKSITRLEQQINDLKLGGRVGKRRRANNTTTDITDSKGLDYGRIWSGVRDGPKEDDLRRKLAISQGMLSSARTVSIFALRGGREDDPDLYPVHLAQDQQSAECVREMALKGHNLDLPYQLTPEQPLKPTACFYIRLSNEVNNVFRAIYLTVRTVEDLKKKICEKYRIEQSKVVRLLRIINGDSTIIIDDNFVRELPEGQTMIFDICETISAIDDDFCSKEIRLKF